MKTKYILTTTDPDEIDPKDFQDELEDCQTFMSLDKAKKELRSFAKRTNCHLYLLEIKLVDDAEGALFKREKNER